MLMARCAQPGLRTARRLAGRPKSRNVAILSGLQIKFNSIMTSDAYAVAGRCRLQLAPDTTGIVNNIARTLPAELKRRIDAGETPCILDVREPWELAICGLPGARHIPLNEIPARFSELDATSAIIVVCKGGGRSRRAAKYLTARGFSRVSTLAGGIDAWAREVDPALPTY